MPQLGLAPDYEWTYDGPAEVGYFGRRCGGEKIASFFETLASKETRFKLEMTLFVAEGDMFAVFGKYTTTSKATRRTITITLAQLLRIRDGRIHPVRNYADTTRHRWSSRGLPFSQITVFSSQLLVL